MLQGAPGSGQGDAACAAVVFAPKAMVISKAGRAVCFMCPLVDLTGSLW
jgi:hypothetical protein